MWSCGLVGALVLVILEESNDAPWGGDSCPGEQMGEEGQMTCHSVVLRYTSKSNLTLRSQTAGHRSVVESTLLQGTIGHHRVQGKSSREKRNCWQSGDGAEGEVHPMAGRT